MCFQVYPSITRTAWAVFKYCGTKTVPLKIKKKCKIDLTIISKKRGNLKKGQKSGEQARTSYY
jgi:hypothetical protein